MSATHGGRVIRGEVLTFRGDPAVVGRILRFRIEDRVAP